MRKVRTMAAWGALVAVGIGLGSLSAATGPGVNQAGIAQLDDGASGDDWPGTGRTYNEQHFSPLAQIDQANVGTLGLAWSMDLGMGNAASQPVEVGGVLYFSTGMSVVHAVDVRTGKLLWRHDPEVWRRGGIEMRQYWGNRGIAWWNGKLYTGTVDGQLIALDAKTGKPVWTAQTVPVGGGQYITGAPRVFKGRIIIGQGGSDNSLTRGYVTAYDAETGQQVWRFHVVPGNPADGFENKAMEMAAKTWTGEWWKWGGGGAPWNAMTYDAETNSVLIGTGNGYPWNRRIRSPGGGDNLFLCSIVALDADTGAYKWHYQINPGDTWDYNASMDIHLAEIMLDGQRRKVAMTAPKNGFLYVIDRTNGKLLKAIRIAEKITWASGIDMTTGRPIELPEARYPDGKMFAIWPSPRGAHSWMPSAFSPKTGLIYIPQIEHGINIDDKGLTKDNWKPFGVNFGPPTGDPLDNRSALVAWDPSTGKQAWKVDQPGGWTGGALATAGGLVFQGRIDGRFSAYAADSGKELWSFAAQTGILAAPITYRVAGKQYVSLLVGVGGSASTEASSHAGIAYDGRTQKNRVLTFVLGGKAKLPAPPPRYVAEAPEDADYKPDADLALKGLYVFGPNCMNCHGVNAVGAGWAPDLRTSAIPQSKEAFAELLRGGLLMANGMPRFAELTDEQLEAMRQYLRSRSADLRAGKP
jgi:quinohemoprotein ethanol dehydrogenase